MQKIKMRFQSAHANCWSLINSQRPLYWKEPSSSAPPPSGLGNSCLLPRLQTDLELLAWLTILGECGALVPWSFSHSCVFASTIRSPSDTTESHCLSSHPNLNPDLLDLAATCRPTTTQVNMLYVSDG